MITLVNVLAEAVRTKAKASQGIQPGLAAFALSVADGILGKEEAKPQKEDDLHRDSEDCGCDEDYEDYDPREGYEDEEYNEEDDLIEDDLEDLQDELDEDDQFDAIGRAAEDVNADLSPRDELLKPSPESWNHKIFRKVSKKALRKFREYHEKNPALYQMFSDIALKTLYSGQKKYSAKCLMEVLRWQNDLEDVPEKKIKINNNYTSLYARLLIANNNLLKDFFELRS